MEAERIIEPESKMEAGSYLQNYLRKAGWETRQESSDIKYYAKKGSPVEFPKAKQEPQFREVGKKKQTSLGDLLERMEDFFAKKQYASMKGMPVGSTMKEDTLFIGAGIQAAYISFLKGAIAESRPHYLAQPCIRISAMDKVGTREGYSTAFVNACTEHFNSTPEEHFAHLDDWLEFLSGQGIYAGHLSLVEDPSWTGGKFMEGKSLLVYYAGMQIGDAVFANAQNPDGSRTAISDIGFGLERIAWGLQKTGSYYEVISPFFGLQSKGRESLDLIRAMTLMTASKIVPSQKGAGYRFRQCAKRYVEMQNDISPIAEIRQYHPFWAGLIEQPAQELEAENAVLEEIQRQLVAKIAGMAKIPFDISGTKGIEDLIMRCKRQCPAKMPEVEEAVRKHISGNKERHA